VVKSEEMISNALRELAGIAERPDKVRLGGGAGKLYCGAWNR
jgi:hypothetical protein